MVGMTPSEVTQARLALRWNKAELARALGRGEQTIRNWESGKTAVPEREADWLARSKRFFDTFPPPVWRK